MKVRAWADCVLHDAEALELLGEVLADRSEIRFSTLDTADAIGVVVAHAIHQRQDKTGPFEHRFAVFLREATFDKRCDTRPIRIALTKVFESPSFFGGKAEHHHVAWLLPAVQQTPFQGARAWGAAASFEVAFSTEHLKRRAAIFFITECCDGLAEPAFAVGKKTPIVGVFFFEKRIDDLNVAVLRLGELGGDC